LCPGKKNTRMEDCSGRTTNLLCLRVDHCFNVLGATNSGGFFAFLPDESCLLVQYDRPAILPSAVLGNSLCLIRENVLLHIFQANKIPLPAVLAQMCSSYIAGFIVTDIMSELSGKGAGTHTVFSLGINCFF